MQILRHARTLAAIDPVRNRRVRSAIIAGAALLVIADGVHLRHGAAPKGAICCELLPAIARGLGGAPGGEAA